MKMFVRVCTFLRLVLVENKFIVFYFESQEDFWRPTATTRARTSERTKEHFPLFFAWRTDQSQRSWRLSFGDPWTCSGTRSSSQRSCRKSYEAEQPMK
jgi:hypothetical protein